MHYSSISAQKLCSPVVLFLIRDIHKNHTMICMKTVDLSGLYYYPIYNIQITYLDGYCSIHYPLCVSVIETLLYCLFFHQWLNNWSNHFMSFGWLLLVFGFYKDSISTKYSTRWWWFFAFIIGIIVNNILYSSHNEGILAK